MNSSTFRRVCLLAAAALVMFLPARAATSLAANADVLKVQVIVPPTCNLLFGDKVSEALVDRMREVLDQAGFTRPVEEVRSFEIPCKVPYLLTINVTDWRFDQAGNVKCTFTANLKTPSGTHELGTYANTTTQWLDGPVRFGLSQGFIEAAEIAVRDLDVGFARTGPSPNSNQRSNA